MVTSRLSEDDKARIEQAVIAAERRTTGEIVCVLARQVSAYPETPIAAGVLGALATAPMLVAFGADAAVGRLTAGWEAAHAAAAADQVRRALFDYALLQAGLFALFGLFAAVPPVRRLLTPRFLKRARVREAAFRQFLSTGLATDAGRTGVVIFAALGERMVEVVADRAIDQACGEATWRAAVEAVQAGMKGDDPGGGFVRAVEICGEALAAAFPAGSVNPDTLVNRPLEF